jgi:hypothetical protein
MTPMACPLSEPNPKWHRTLSTIISAISSCPKLPSPPSTQRCHNPRPPYSAAITIRAHQSPAFLLRGRSSSALPEHYLHASGMVGQPPRPQFCTKLAGRDRRNHRIGAMLHSSAVHTDGDGAVGSASSGTAAPGWAGMALPRLHRDRHRSHATALPGATPRRCCPSRYGTARHVAGRGWHCRLPHGLETGKGPGRE